MKFDTLGLSSPLLNAITECGYQQLTQVQQQVIPLALVGKDIMACAQTGTGKTAAFALPVLEQLAAKPADKPLLRALVMTPTRELAIQVCANIQKYSQFLPLKTLAVYGGANMNPQRKGVEQGVDILVATPGRLFDIIGQFNLDLSSVTTLVIDEADRMLDLGFVRDIEKVKRLIAPVHQTMLFSATYSDAVKQLSHKMLNQPQWVNVAENTTASTVEQLVYRVDKRRKAELLSELVGRNNWRQVLVFASTKECAEHLLQELTLDGISAGVFHGDKTQGARNRVLDDFKAGKLRVLVATDVAARGLDIQALPLVINLELPFLAEDYVHRIGRTGRAGLSGRAISFVSPADDEMLAEIEALIGEKLPVTVQPGYEEGTPLPARYRDLPVVTTKTKWSYKAPKDRTIGKSSAGGKSSESQARARKSPSREGKYSKDKAKVSPSQPQRSGGKPHSGHKLK
ncbi:DEAD/DEAH box helicase [Shewanella oneidensis]|uniref:ATP-dependent RNA helicase DEAD box family n=1 Tax=Shewanella oneidensis (strain ATCC 700550 / JCM 31522 / CIP 106686 / LMG 19005 / NCIMB 14063 / MR-1) TaxID=211586 RepID=Q8EGU0_SHEON|nr:DEAD/DEAH box helicase [Shewanella oneidensis]AAN54562.1 ATP-dependent RNA helicase DEAD box family [Shewanella oneidensis MR-1]MDX5996676.1 DEAD/DEAH box helicase [Shewanella oneidensis]MEE2028088.1 ATP-dependent RNA helicase RhlE [Shewanella oneidensis]